MRSWVAAFVLVTVLTPARAEAPSKAERQHEWTAIAYFRSTSSGDIVSSGQAIFATEKDCRRWVRHRANSDFWRVWNVATPNCISQEVSMMTLKSSQSRAVPAEPPLGRPTRGPEAPADFRKRDDDARVPVYLERVLR